MRSSARKGRWMSLSQSHAVAQKRLGGQSSRNEGNAVPTICTQSRVPVTIQVIDVPFACHLHDAALNSVGVVRALGHHFVSQLG